MQTVLRYHANTISFIFQDLRELGLDDTLVDWLALQDVDLTELEEVVDDQVFFFLNLFSLPSLYFFLLVGNYHLIADSSIGRILSCGTFRFSSPQ